MLDIDLFMDKVSPEPMTGCWLWTGSLNNSGYGSFAGKTAHRSAYRLFVGPIPGGLDIDHLCRMRSCVNPAHLEPVTRKVNVNRGIAAIVTRARRNSKTHCNHGHEFTPENCYYFRGNRACCACIKARSHKFYIKRKYGVSS